MEQLRPTIQIVAIYEGEVFQLNLSTCATLRSIASQKLEGGALDTAIRRKPAGRRRLMWFE